jgi:hypothetical protein
MKDLGVDLNAIAQSDSYKFKLESLHAEDKEDAKLRRKKDWWLFLATLTGVVVTFGICAYLCLFNQLLSNTALNGIIGLTLGLSGYYIRGSQL